MSSCSNSFAISLFERIGIVCPGGSLTGASVILFRSGAGWSASSLRSASATRSRSVDPRLTAAILARFSRSSGRSNVERINITILFSCIKLWVSLLACQRHLTQVSCTARYCFIYDLSRQTFGNVGVASSNPITPTIDFIEISLPIFNLGVTNLGPLARAGRIHHVFYDESGRRRR
jgi:hypothetical protein